MLLDLKPEQIPRFDNFVAGSNAELLGRLRALADPGCFDAIYLWGAAGSGKSHLLEAARLAAEGQRPVLAARGGDEICEFAVRPGSLLVVDDADRLGEEGQGALFRTFNAARLAGLALLLSGSAPPLRLGLREDLRTRVGQCLIYEVKSLTEDEKSAALLRHALERGMAVDDGLVRYLLRHGRRDLPSLMSVLERLDHATLERKQAATLPLLKQVMQLPLENPDEPGPL